MIKSSFIFLDRIGERKERLLWEKGILCWDDFLNVADIEGISAKTKRYYDMQIRKASESIRNGYTEFFTHKLGLRNNWRLYSLFRDEAVFLDIESSGVTEKDDIIVIGLYDGRRDKIMIKGVNMDVEYLKRELSQYKLIITYNGASFDVPFIKKRYPQLLPGVPHIDLKPVCQRAGLSNGLKDIEEKFGISRNPVLKRLYGGDVYRLWRMAFASGDEYYMNLLAEYNQEDVINLKTIADYAIRENEKMLMHPGMVVSS